MVAVWEWLFHWVFTLMMNWCGPIDVGPLYTWGLIRCLAFSIIISKLYVLYSPNLNFAACNIVLEIWLYWLYWLYCLFSSNRGRNDTVVVSQFYIQHNAGFYLWARSEPVLYPAQGWTVLNRNRSHWTAWSLWTVLQTGVDSSLDKNTTGNIRRRVRRDSSHWTAWSCLES